MGPEVGDAEAAFHNRLLEHVLQRTRLGPHEEGPGAAPPTDVAEAEERFCKWRSEYVGQFLDLDFRIPVLKINAEQMRTGVADALNKTCGGKSVLSFVKGHLTRRHRALQTMQSMVLSRQQWFCHADPAEISAGVGSGRRHGTATACLRKLEKELEVSSSRVQCVQAQTSHDPIASSVPWLCSGVVLVRQLVSEELATRALRHFLTQLQCLGLRHRTRLWKRSLEFHAIMKLAAQGEPGVAGPLTSTQAPLPLGVSSRRQLERALLELGPVFGCSASLQSDKGKTFAHQVTLVFPEIFEVQQQRMEFKVYPIGEALGKDTEEPQIVRPVSEESSNSREVFYLRELGWNTHGFWKPRLEQSLLEQSVLLHASFSAANTPERVRHKPATYAQQLLEHVVTSEKPAASEVREGLEAWECDVDSVLRAEWAFLEAGESKMVMRRLGELAENRTRTEEGGAGRSDGDGPEERHAMPQPLLRAYFMLRHLQCRAQRWRLLSLVNFNRFVLHRLVASSEPKDGNRPPSHLQTQHNSASTSRRGEDRYWNLSPRTLSRSSRHCPMPSTPRPEGTAIAQGTVLRQPSEGHIMTEGLVKLEGGTLAVVDQSGRRIVHAGALDDLKAVEREMLSIGSFYIHKFEAAANGDVEQLTVDRIGVLHDLYAAEVRFNEEKRNLLELYYEIYEHTADLLERTDLQQRMVDIMALRPRLNLEEDSYFAEAYAAAVCNLSQRVGLLRLLLDHQLASERAAAAAASAQLVQLGGGKDASESRAHRGRSAGRQASGEAKENTGIDALDAAVSSLPHAYEGYQISSGDTHPSNQIQVSPGAQRVQVDEFCRSACLTWKAELLLEEVHRDLVKHFHPSSPVMVTLLERACYSFASEQWRAVAPGDISEVCRPHDNPELLLQIVREVAHQLSGSLSHTQGEQQQQAEEEEEQQHPPLLKALGGLDLSGFLLQGFAELRRKCSYNAAGMAGHMLAHLLEHLYLRRQVAATTWEVAVLEGALRAQAVSCGLRLESLRPQPLHDPNTDTPRGEGAAGPAQNTWIDSSAPMLSAGMLSTEMGAVDLGSGRNLALHCSHQRVQELRHIYQHELAYRNLVLCCVQHNAFLLDPQARQKEIGDVMLVGPSRDLIAGDAGAVTLRKLRETLELSGPLRNDRPPRTQVSSRAQRRAKNAETAGFVDMSRYGHHLLAPTLHVGQVLASVSLLYQEKVAALRTNARPVESERQARALWYSLLVCSSSFINACASDLSVRLQAVAATNTFRSIAALLPARLSPFDRTQDHKQPLVERDGQVGNIFSVPGVLEVLQLRSTDSSVFSDMTSAMRGFFATLTPSASEKSKAKELDTLEPVSDCQEGVAELQTPYNGPAATLLRLVHGLTTLVLLHYALAVIRGPNTPLMLMRMRRFARFNFVELEAGQEDVSDSLGSTEPTLEGLEEMCSDLARLAWRLDGLAEASKEPAKVLAVVHSEVRVAHRQLSLLLRLAARPRPNSAQADSFQRYALASEQGLTGSRGFAIARKLEGAPAEARDAALLGGKPLKGAPQHFRGPLAAMEVFAPLKAAESDAWLLPAPGPGLLEGTEQLPELTSAYEDFQRYLQVACPGLPHPNPLLHKFLQRLLWAHVDVGIQRLANVAGEDSMKFQPHVSRLPWQHPEPPLLQLVSLLCTLPRPEHHEVSRIHAELMDKRDSFLKYKGVKAQSNEAAEVDAEFFGSLLLREIVDEHLASTATAVSSLPREETLDMLHEMEAVHRRNQVSTPALKHMLVATASSQLAREFAALVEVRHRTRGVNNIPLAAGPDPGPGQGPHPHARKVDALLYGLNRLRAAGTYVQMNPNSSSGEKAYVLREQDLDACIEELMATLPEWGFRAVHGRDRLASGLLAHLERRLARHSAGLRHAARAASKLAAGSLGPGSPLQRDAWARSEVAGRGCRLVLEVDRLHRLIKDLQVASDELGHRLGSEIWDRAREALAELTGAVARESGGYEERFGGRAHAFASQLRDLREHVASGLAALASKNFLVQERASQGRRRRRWDDEEAADAEEEEMPGTEEHLQPQPLQPQTQAQSQSQAQGQTQAQGQPQPLPISDGMFSKLREVAQRDDAEALEKKVLRLQSRQVCARFFHHFKCQTLRQRFDERMKALHMTLQSNCELSARLAHASQSERVVAQEITATAKGMSTTEQRIEELRAQVEADTQHRHRLQNWRRSKAKQLAHIDQAVREHQRAGSADAEGLLGQLQTRSELLQQLQRERGGEEAAVDAAGRSGRQRAQKAQEQLQSQRSAKDSARLELQELRADVERGGLDGEARLQLWKGRITAAAQRLQELERENRHLKHVVGSSPAHSHAA